MSKIKYEECPKCVSIGNDTSGDNFVIFPNGTAHCFACGNHRNPVYYVPSIKNVNDWPKSLLPIDFTREVPATAWKWLLQYELPWSYWKEAVGYSPKEKRLIFRVGDTSVVGKSLESNGQSLQFSIGRYVGEQEEERKPRKWYVWGDPHKHCEVIGEYRGDSIVLVEDLISAHKVGQVTATIPLFGTQIHPPVLYYLNNNTKPIYIWLDKDQSGVVTKKAYNLQLLLNKSVRVLTTDKDPKSYTIKEINKTLNENLRN